MEKCTFYEIVGSDCGPHIPPRKDVTVSEIIPLGNCTKNIDGHMKLLQLSRSEIKTEAELIDLFSFLRHSLVTWPEMGKQTKHSR